ncbi:hypothetical protein YPPY58_1890, partial [Yersinia pestis PY-58]
MAAVPRAMELACLAESSFVNIDANRVAALAGDC